MLVDKPLPLSELGAETATDTSGGREAMTARCRLLCVAVLAVSCTPALVRADLVWEYLSTNSFTTVSGQMTTTGNPGDQLIPGTLLSLVSFNTVFVNSVDITPASNWSSSN